MYQLVLVKESGPLSQKDTVGIGTMNDATVDNHADVGDAGT